MGLNKFSKFRLGNRNIHRFDSAIKSQNTDPFRRKPSNQYFRFHFVAHPWRNEEKQASRSKPPFEICTPATGYLSKIDRQRGRRDKHASRRDVGTEKPATLKDESEDDLAVPEWLSRLKRRYETITGIVPFPG